MKILIIDDDPDIRLAARIALSIDPNDIHEAENLDTALKSIKAAIPDVILLDYELGDTTGEQVLTEMLKLPGMGSAQVIFLTGKTSDEIISRLSELPIAGIISKPFDLETFSSSIQNLIHK